MPIVSSSIGDYALQLALAIALIGWCPWIQWLKTRNRSWTFAAVAGLLASLSFWTQPGDILGIFLVLPWAAWCLTHFYFSNKQSLLWGHDHFGHLINGIAAILLLGAFAWLGFTRVESPLLGFNEPWKTLTAIHFHYSGFLMLSFIALHWQKVRSKTVFQVSSCSYVLSFVFVAVGINGSRFFELLGVTLLCGSMVICGALIFLAHRPYKGITQLIAFLWACLGLTTFTLAFLYGWRISPVVSLPFMISSHGLLNAFVLLPLLLIYSAQTQQTALPIRKIPFSRLRSKWRVGPDFFATITLQNQFKTGLLDSMDEFNRSDFKSDQVHRQVCEFYERTADFEMSVSSLPSGPFKPVWRWLAKPFFAGIQQLNLPDSDKNIFGEIIALDPALDGRSSPRGWIRIDKKTGRSVYAAAYAMHSDTETTYMNIAFPLPLSNLTSVLHIEHLPDQPGAVRLTTLKDSNSLGDQGVYLVLFGMGLRLPIDEIIDVWFENVLRARHTMWFFGWQYLTLEYQVTPKKMDPTKRFGDTNSKEEL